jgi:CRP-like cAMP-binding protein
LGADNKRWLDRAIVPGAQLKLRLFEKIVFYQSLPIFENISGLALSFLSDISKEIRLAPAHTLSLDEKINNDFFIVFKGLVQYYDRSQYVMDYQPGQFIGEIIAQAGFANSNLLVAKEDTILLKINKDEFYELLSDNVNLADRVLENI